MLADRIRMLLKEMNVTISDVARAGGCSPSNLNRLKNGKRTPPPSSSTTAVLTDGFIKIADQRGLRGELCGLCGADAFSDNAVLSRQLVVWLYEDEAPYERKYTRHSGSAPGEAGGRSSKLPGFSMRLDRLMKEAGMSNGRLGRTAGLDPSYISRLRRAERFPRYDSPYLDRICRALRDEMLGANRLSDLAGMLMRTQEELADEEGAEIIRDWLFGSGSVASHIAAGELIEAVSSAGMVAAASLSDHSYDMDRIIRDCDERSRSTAAAKSMRQYDGIEGLRSAVSGFLAELLENGETEMLLYSDQSMEWMGGEYYATLTALMSECMKRNVHIKVVHNVSRSMTELVMAVRWWMPLYLSGNIESFYCKKSAGSRFSHTLFIRPGAACISGTSVFGAEDSSIYFFTTEPDMTEAATRSFESLLRDSEPLVLIERRPRGEEGFVSVDDVLIKAVPGRVVIKRTEKPLLSFTFTHPMICRAFEECMKTN